MGSRIARVATVGVAGMTGLLGMALVVSGCVVQVGETRTVSRSVEVKDARSVKAEVVASSANLDVSGGGGTLMSADFRFNNDNLEPEVEYSESGDGGSLSVRQPTSGFVTMGPHLVNEWDITFGKDVPIDLAVDLSSGNADLDLSDIDLRSADIHASSGDLKTTLGGDHPDLARVKVGSSSGHITLGLGGSYDKLEDVRVDSSSGNVECDLSGTWTLDADVDIQASSGGVRVTVPDDVNVRVRAETSSGEVSADGFTVEGEDYVLMVSDDAPTLTIRVDVSSGDVTLEIG